MKCTPFVLLTACLAAEPTLPPVLGQPPAVSAEEWAERVRPRTLESFRSEVYGRAPVGRPDRLSFETIDESREALGGQATRRVILIRFGGPGGDGEMRLSLLIPNDKAHPAPVLLLICNRDPQNIDPTRETKSEFWPAEEIVSRGYAAAAFHYADLDPDHPDDFQNGVHGIFDTHEGERPGDAWGAIAAWSWGASRALDYFESDEDVDAKRVGVIGHSRGGKAALWAGARDTRFAMTVSNNSGCTGAALARRLKGERISDINGNFPHWFCRNYEAYNGAEEKLPVDQHQLLALIAPRLLYVASASEDAWADPEGEFLAAVHATPVYQLFGDPGLGTSEMPEPGGRVGEGRIGYHLREGRHNLTAYDWERFMDFADRHLTRPEASE